MGNIVRITKASMTEAIKKMNPELSKYEVREEVLKLIESVGLNPDHAYKYPYG